MGRISIFFFVLVAIMIYPIYVLTHQKINKNKRVNYSISLYTIFNGKFKKYDTNLTEIGSFTRLDVFKNYYLAKNLNVINLVKKENFFAKRAKYKRPYLYADFFIYKNQNYVLNSKKARYNFNTKVFDGKVFKLRGKTYKVKGKSFLVDKERNIRATDTVFDLKVDK